MSHSNLSNRMATSIALALTAAAITACGGGATDSQGVTDTASGANTEITSPEAAASAAVVVTTNSAAVAAATDDGISAIDAPTIVAAADTATSDIASVSSATAQQSSTSASTTPASNTSTGSSPSSSTTKPVGASSGSTPAIVTGVRPAGNTGTGFFVADGKLYDAKGKEFRIRGVNRTHWDSYGSSTGIAASGANTERIALNYTRATTDNFAIITKQMLANKIVPMPGNWAATCKSDPASLSAIVDTWVAQASTWTVLNSNGLINIANEWGPENSPAWRDGYVTAIARMRAAGYTGTLVVDSGGCGQDSRDVIKYGADVLAADPQKNILFDVHVYGGFYFPATASWMQDYSKAMAALKATGLPIIIGEFGPGRKVGPSPTLITPEQVIATAEANGWGWLPWSWDDNNLLGCGANDYWFSMTTKCGLYKTSDDLTTFGKSVVPTLQQLATKATIFN